MNKKTSVSINKNIKHYDEIIMIHKNMIFMQKRDMDSLYLLGLM